MIDQESTRPGFWTRFFTPEIRYEPGTFVPEFDAWRGIGIGCVLFAHAFREKFLFAWIFLDLFFVLSGFLITGILLDTLNKPGYLKNFISRRVLRVFPVYYLSLFVLFYLIPDSVLDLAYYREKQGWFWLYVQNWLFSFEGFPAQKALHHFWSLAVEEQFYIVWPFVVMLLPRKGIVYFCAFLAVFSIIFRNFGDHLGLVPPYYYVATFSRMEGLVFGAICAVLIRQNKHFLEKAAPYLVLIFGSATLVLFAAAGSMDFLHPLNYRVTYTMVDVFFCGVILFSMASHQFRWLNRILLNRSLIWLGTISYGVYIIHYPILEIFLNNFQDVLVAYVKKDALAKLICVAGAYTCTITLAYLSFRYFEKPLLRLKRYFTPKAAASAA
ncbi:MAG: acyltransferase [Mucilaginibacter polytrichastri]|nr:acyltransferase [Mucilaginibacter polytrichastri]